jgi:hypothetical protein
MEAGRGVVAEKNEMIALNMMPAFMIEQTFSFAMAPPSNEVREKEVQASIKLLEADHALGSGSNPATCTSCPYFTPVTFLACPSDTVTTTTANVPLPNALPGKYD